MIIVSEYIIHSFNYIMELNMNYKPEVQFSTDNDNLELRNTDEDNHINNEKQEFSNE